MRTYFISFCVALCCLWSAGQSYAADTTPLSEDAKAELLLKIEQIDRLIDELYAKEKVATLKERDYVRLERLREARMWAELRLQRGTDDRGKIDELMENLTVDSETEESPGPAVKPTVSPAATEQKTESDKDQEIARLLRELKAQSSKEDGETGATNSLSAQEKPVTKSNVAVKSIEEELAMTPEVRELYREIVTPVVARIAELDQKIAAAKTEIENIMDDDFPGYADIYERLRDVMDLSYDRSLARVELRQSLRDILSPEQMRKWIAADKKAQALPSAKPETAVDAAKKPAQITDETGIIYVPMRLVETEGADGKKIYKAVPIE